VCIDRLALFRVKAVFRESDELFIVEVFTSQPEFRGQRKTGRYGTSFFKSGYEQLVTLSAIRDVSPNRREFGAR
jgi:hypothetical protein